MLSNFKFILSLDMLPTIHGRPQPKPGLATSMPVAQQEVMRMRSLANLNLSLGGILLHSGLKDSANPTLSHRIKEEQDRCRRILLRRLMPEHVHTLELLRPLMPDNQDSQLDLVPRQYRRGVIEKLTSVASLKCPLPLGHRWVLKNDPPHLSPMDETRL